MEANYGLVDAIRCGSGNCLGDLLLGSLSHISPEAEIGPAGQGGDPMNRRVVLFLVAALAVALVPLIIKGIAHLTVRGINAVSNGIESLIHPLSMTGDARMEGIIQLCLYLIVATLIVSGLFRRRGGS